MNTQLLAGRGMGWAEPLFELVTLHKLLENFTGGIFAPGALIPACCTAPQGGGEICFWLSLAEAWCSFPSKQKEELA